MVHKSVLLKEVVDGLNIKPGDVFLDCTLGAGGHSLEVCRRHKSLVTVIGIDAYGPTLEQVRELLARENCNSACFQVNFRDLDAVLAKASVGSPSAILFDLGWSSDIMENSGLGFSFRKDEPLIMSYGEVAQNAALILNSWKEEDLMRIFWEYGEERNARRIAKTIVSGRRKKRITTTFELVDLIKQALGFRRYGRIHFATKVFQALRIAVNDELGALRAGLSKAIGVLGLGGRIAVISFNSLEDRIVKNFFKEIEKEGAGKIVTKKPIVPSREEVVSNPRSRSAKLRIFLKI